MRGSKAAVRERAEGTDRGLVSAPRFSENVLHTVGL